ncbi:hypothetical protein BKA65DRAFT_87767 [Rhexocercosporidium sp. MPI-PUGE-AT-0058]|nr:hypothetical protein BKA65DRAFT_87767 [Rhexocercosporidium sp. MPI-PUGE-AT-0058]
MNLQGFQVLFQHRANNLSHLSNNSRTSLTTNIMNFFKKSFSSASLPLCQPYRPPSIDKLLLKTTRVNCSLQLPFRPFSTISQCRPNLYTCNPKKHLTIRLRRKHKRSSPKIYFEQPVTSRWQPPHVRTGNLVVVSLVGACVGIFFWNGHLQSEARQKATREARKKASDFYENFVMTVRSLEPGRYYTLISSAFMHRDVMHLGLCMLGLFTIGRTVVAGSGVPSFLVLYFGSAVAGGVAQVKFWEASSSPYTVNYGMGSSGAISGLFAALACSMPTSRILLLFIPMPMFVAAALNVGISVGGMQGRWLQNWGHADHLGGMAFGALWWALAMRRRAPLGDCLDLGFRPWRWGSGVYKSLILSRRPGISYFLLCNTSLRFCI